MRFNGLLKAAGFVAVLWATLVACSSSDSTPSPSEQGGSAGHGASAAGQGGGPSGGSNQGGQGGVGAKGGSPQGGSSGTLQDSGAGGSGNASGSAGDSGIIPGLGPVQKDILGLFTIDTTEVTRDQYAQWLATNPDPATGQPAACKWKKSFTPSCEWPAGSKGNHPVVCVDWCDAYAFCAAGGRHLCGKIGGGPSPYADYKTAGVDEWFHACSSGGKTAYPYGDTYAAQACNGAEAAQGGTWAVGSGSGCQSSASGFEQVMDMSGNVLEWQNNCQADAGQGDYCRARGGSYNHGPSALVCSDGAGHFRDDRLSVIGFRCCNK